MTTAVLSCLASIGLLLWCMATHPKRFRCPPGWYASEGIRRDGRFACVRPPIGGDGDPGTTTAVDQPGKLHGRIYCTGGAQYVVDSDGQTVGCQR